MRNKSFTFTMAAASANGVCQSQTPGGAGALTINGALATGGVATFAVPRKLSVTSAADESARTIVVAGTDRGGSSQTESLTCGHTTTVQTTKCYATITSLTIDAASAGALTAGSGDSAFGIWIPLSRIPGYTFQVSLTSGASMNWAIEGTLDDVWGSSFAESTANVFTIFGNTMTDTSAFDASLVSSYVASLKTIEYPVAAIRIAIDDFASGTLTLRIAETKDSM